MDRNFINPSGRLPQEIVLRAAANTMLQIEEKTSINVQKYKMLNAEDIFAGKQYTRRIVYKPTLTLGSA